MENLNESKHLFNPSADSSKIHWILKRQWDGVTWILLGQNTEKFLENSLNLKQKLSNYLQTRAVSLR